MHNMNQSDIEEMLRQSLVDGKLSRAEKSTLKAILTDDADTAHERDLLRNRAFEIARQSLLGPDARKAVDWLEDVIRLPIICTTSSPCSTKRLFSQAVTIGLARPPKTMTRTSSLPTNRKSSAHSAYNLRNSGRRCNQFPRNIDSSLDSISECRSLFQFLMRLQFGSYDGKQF